MAKPTHPTRPTRQGFVAYPYNIYLMADGEASSAGERRGMRYSIKRS